MTSVPFTIGNVFGGLGIAHGVLRNVADDLVLEFQVKDGVFGLLRSEVKEVRIPLCSIEEISLDRMWADPLQLLGLGSWLLRIRTMHIASVVDIPGHEEVGFRLKVSRKYRKDARALLSEAELRIVEIRLREIETLSKEGLT